MPIKTTVSKTFRDSAPNVSASVDTCNGKMNRLVAKLDWTMPSNSVHKMQFEIVADGPYYDSGFFSDGKERIACNKPLVLVEALEDLARIARGVYDMAMAESNPAAAEKVESES